MTPPPHQAMLLAAGLGTRMRPLTEHTAKPLLTIRNRTLLDHALDRLAEAGVTQVVVNTHWQADAVSEHLATRTQPRLLLRHEPTLLETGGAVAAALTDGMLDDAPFYLVNGDAFWLDGPTSALLRLAGHFDPARADACMLLHRTSQIMADVGAGDFMLDEWGRPSRRAELQVVPYLYAGIQVATPALYAHPPEGPFSTNVLWDRAIAAGRLEALVHDGLWFHLSTPADLLATEENLDDHATGETR